jgi:hypothetical protein
MNRPGAKAALLGRGPQEDEAIVRNVCVQDAGNALKATGPGVG